MYIPKWMRYFSTDAAVERFMKPRRKSTRLDIIIDWSCIALMYFIGACLTYAVFFYILHGARHGY